MQTMNKVVIIYTGVLEEMVWFVDVYNKHWNTDNKKKMYRCQSCRKTTIVNIQYKVTK